MTDLACREITDLLTDYLEGELPAPARERFDAHLAECPFCTTYVEQMRATIDRLGRLEEGSLPDEVRERLAAAFREGGRR
jgi:anti-sigma factor RsiW